MYLATALFKFYESFIEKTAQLLREVKNISGCQQLWMLPMPGGTWPNRNLSDRMNTGMIGILERSNYGFRCREERESSRTSDSRWLTAKLSL